MALTPPTDAFTLKLHIEELILHGFADRDRQLIGAAIEQELARLLTEAGPKNLPVRSLELGRVDAGSVHLGPDTQPHVVGRHVAERVFSQLTQPQGNGGQRHA